MLKRQEERLVIHNNREGFVIDDRCCIGIDDNSGSRLNPSDNRRHHQDRFEANQRWRNDDLLHHFCRR